MKKVFKIQKHDGSDKSFAIDGPMGFYLSVDYDDVDHDTVDQLAIKVVEILNAQWQKSFEEEARVKGFKVHLKSRDHKDFCDEDCTAAQYFKA